MADHQTEKTIDASDAVRGAWPWVLFGLQAFCVVMLLAESLADLFGTDHGIGIQDSDTFEYVIIAVLSVSLIASGIEIRKSFGRQKRMEQQIQAASGEFAKLLEDHFEEWRLTPSERDVALLAIKGFTINEIAELRDTRDGTVKAQCNAIYRKAGVSGRPQLLSVFIDELMQGALLSRGMPVSSN